MVSIFWWSRLKLNFIEPGVDKVVIVVVLPYSGPPQSGSAIWQNKVEPIAHVISAAGINVKIQVG